MWRERSRGSMNKLRRAVGWAFWFVLPFVILYVLYVVSILLFTKPVR
jgi:uncharacterized membrane protein